MKPKHEFEYVADQIERERQEKKEREENNRNTEGFSIRFIVWLSIGLVIAITGIVAAGSFFDSEVGFWTSLVLIVVALLVCLNLDGVLKSITRYGK